MNQAPTYRLEDIAGPDVDPESHYAKKWTGEPSTLKLRQGLTIAVPPMHQDFWMYGDRADRLARKANPPLVKQFGFVFFMPNYSGFVPSNYLNVFDQDRVEVTIYRVDPEGDGSSVPYSDTQAMLRRGDGSVYHLNRYQELHGLRCYGSLKDAFSATCEGPRHEGERVWMRVTLPEYPEHIPHPRMDVRYYTRNYGGLEVNWLAPMKHFPRWDQIDRQIWQFIDDWTIHK